MGGTNFTACAAQYSPLNASMQQLYGWKGPVWDIPKNESTQITTAACKILCGTGSDYYPWSQSSSTITTWVLPVIGVLLQAPFVSNAFWETIFSTARWVGSPIASLSYILWNIKISGKAALLVDMASPYDDLPTDRRSNFQSMRDSLYLLVTLNQYSISEEVLRANKHDSKPAEGLLRVALFSKDLHLLKRKRVSYELENEQPVEEEPDDRIFATPRQPPNRDGSSHSERFEPEDELNEERQRIAQQLRETRRKGVVPVFISTLWFLFAMAISIQSSFGQMGQNEVAHDLALGCLLAWLPVLILCSIVDRNPVSADDVRKKMNRLVDHVRKSLMDDEVRFNFINTIDSDEERSEMRKRIEELGTECASMNKPFFKDFAGQARVRWHYGAAHPILCDIEDAYIAKRGRYWLRNEPEARTFLVLGKRSGGLDWLDYREIVQICAAFWIVFGTLFGAWILSFYTPTVGLGCRSGGYTIFFVIAVVLLVLELSLWWWFDAKKDELKELHRRATVTFRPVRTTAEIVLRPWWAIRGILYRAAQSCLALLPRLLPLPTARWIRQRVHRMHEAVNDLSPQERWDWYFFKPLESLNTIWLLYRTLSQTFGADNTCDCMTSTWAPGGGYMDFVDWNTSNSFYVRGYWIAGTTLACTVMGIAMIYIVLEWCLQSHLSTADVDNAAAGLRRVRQFRRMTYVLRWVIDRFSDVTHAAECTAVKYLQKFGMLSPEFEVRPKGVRWARRSPPEIRQPQELTPVRAQAVSTSFADSTRASVDDTLPAYSSPPSAHFHDAQWARAGDDALGVLDDSIHLLAPEPRGRSNRGRSISISGSSEHSPSGRAAISP